MRVVELHPEDLLDKLECGKLSGDERTRLESHLRACSECRFEVAVRRDLAEEALAPRARPLPLVGAPPSTRPSAARRGRPPRKAAIVAALAAALVTGGALAAVVTEVVRRGDDAPMRRVEAPLENARRPHAVTRAPVKSPEHAAEPASSEETLSGVAESAAQPGEPAPAPIARTASVRAPNSEGASGRGMPALSPRVAGARGARASEAARNTPPSVDAEPRTAAALFAAANRARRYGETGQAMSLYRALQERFPASEESRLSRATVASLALDRGDPGAALEGFDRYLEQGGSALGVEALVGRAMALQELGRQGAELAAWREVARRFPGTVHARRAAARIAALSAR